MNDDMYEFSAADKKRTLNLVDRLADITDEVEPGITIVALGRFSHIRL